jgi:hypothetical protein
LLAEVRKYAVSVVAVMQWLEQAKSQDEKILQALLNTGVKITMRLRSTEDAQIMASDMIPLDIERPVRALIKPTVVGHRIRRLVNESESENSSRTESQNVTRTKGRADTHSKTQAIARSIFSSESEVETNTAIASTSSGVTTGSGATASEIAVPTGDPANPQITRVVSGTTEHSAETSGCSEGSAHNTGTVKSVGSQETYTEAEGFARTESESEAVGTGTAEQRGRGSTKGSAEALEPIMEERPSAVHSVQTELYRAGLMLRSLPTGTGFCSYVGPRGPVATLFTVPPIFPPAISPDERAAIRQRVIAKSASALSLEAAEKVMRERAARTYTDGAPKPTALIRRSQRKRFDEPEQGDAW